MNPAAMFSDIYYVWTTPTAELVLKTLGALLVIKSLVGISRFLLAQLYGSQLARYNHPKTKGTACWALVTGASDGLGKAYSDELLKRGWNVLLHGRNDAKLEAVKHELLERHPGRKVDTVVADAGIYSSQSHVAVVDKVQSLPQNEPLTLLINNVGGMPFKPQYAPLCSTTHENIDVCINVNLRFMTHLIAALLPILRDNSPSLIANCGSIGGKIPPPYLAAYAATKAYVHTLTQGLKSELAAEGEKWKDVDVVAFVIGNTLTAGNVRDIPFSTTSAACARSSLDNVGASNEALVSSHWTAWMAETLTTIAMNVLPRKAGTQVLASEMRQRIEEERKTK